MTDLRTAAQQALEALEASRRSHYYCEDTWYSCPKHEDGCSNEMEGDECNCGADEANEKIDQSITALRAALAQQAEPFTPDAIRTTQTAWKMGYDAAKAETQQAEPVYWEVRCTAHPKWMRVDEQQFDEYVSYGWEGQRLYTAPPQRKPLTQEPVRGDMRRCPRCWEPMLPPQRKPLTEEEIPALAEKVLKPSVYYDAEALLCTDGLVALVRAVERAHGIKERP